jgi:hypothetical protein
MVRPLTSEQIHAVMLSYGAIRGTDDDGLTHYILRQNADYADLEYASDGSYSLELSVNGESYSANGSDPRHMSQVWQRWYAEAK